MPMRSNFNHLEVFLARAALGAGPVHRDVLPPGSRRNAFVGQARRFAVDETADEAHVRLVNLRVGSGHASFRFTLKSHSNESLVPRPSTLVADRQRFALMTPGSVECPSCHPSCWFSPRPIRAAAPACRPTS